MVNLTISKVIKGLPRLKTHDEVLASYENEFKFVPQYPVVDKATYLGIEVEVENVMRFGHTSPYWTMKDDGSLRNNGREFVTPPIRAHRVEQALTTLFLIDLNPNVDFSERTSIHIHMNVRTLTPRQLYTLVMIYMVFEKALFNFVGNNRDQNIFCNPLHTTTEAGKFTTLETDLYNSSRGWNKYTALNLLPVIEMGTVEFRHMHGTKDIKRIMTWINMLLSMKKYVLKNDHELIEQRILNMNTSSEYNGLCSEVFGELANVLTNYNMFAKDCSYCVTYFKEYYYISDFKRELISTTQGKLGKERNTRYTNGDALRDLLTIGPRGTAGRLDRLLNGGVDRILNAIEEEDEDWPADEPEEDV